MDSLKIIFPHCREGLRTAIRRHLGVRNLLFERVKQADDSYRTEVHIPGSVLETYRQLLEPVFKVYGEPSNLRQHSGMTTGCLSYMEGANHRSLSSCIDERAQNEKGMLGGLANTFIQGAEKMTGIQSIAANAAYAFVETLKPRAILVRCIANIEPKSVSLDSMDIDQFMLQVEQTFPEHFGQHNCNYSRFVFDVEKLGQHVTLTSLDLGTVKEVLVVGSRDITAFKFQYPRNHSAGIDLTSVADSANQTLVQPQGRVTELELELKIEELKTRQVEAQENTRQVEAQENTRQVEAQEKTRQAEHEESTKRLLLELVRDGKVSFADISSLFKNDNC